MTLFYFVVLIAFLIRLFQFLANIAVIFFVVSLFLYFAKQVILYCFYNKIKKIIVVRKKDLVKRHDIPTGYTDGYFGGEHYVYEYERTGVKYKTRVYFGEKLFLVFWFSGNDPFFVKILEDNRIIKNTLPI